MPTLEPDSPSKSDDAPLLPLFKDPLCPVVLLAELPVTLAFGGDRR
jgi:hypothetical protein